MDAVSVLSYVLQTGNQTLANWISNTVNTIVGVLLLLGILSGIAGIIVYIAVGVFEIQLFTGAFSSSGMRKIMHGMYTMIIIPVVIGILYLFNQFAVNGMLYSNVNDTGSIAWMIHQIWIWISSRLSQLFAGGG
jgi:hypothetical protein